jgi:hypothetical protein
MPGGTQELHEQDYFPERILHPWMANPKKNHPVMRAALNFCADLGPLCRVGLPPTGVSEVQVQNFYDTSIKRLFDKDTRFAKWKHADNKARANIHNGDDATKVALAAGTDPDADNLTVVLSAPGCHKDYLHEISRYKLEVLDSWYLMDDVKMQPRWNQPRRLTRDGDNFPWGVTTDEMDTIVQNMILPAVFVGSIRREEKQMPKDAGEYGAINTREPMPRGPMEDYDNRKLREAANLYQRGDLPRWFAEYWAPAAWKAKQNGGTVLIMDNILEYDFKRLPYLALELAFCEAFLPDSFVRHSQLKSRIHGRTYEWWRVNRRFIPLEGEMYATVPYGREAENPGRDGRRVEDYRDDGTSDDEEEECTFERSGAFGGSTYFSNSIRDGLGKASMRLGDETLSWSK